MMEEEEKYKRFRQYDPHVSDCTIRGYLSLNNGDVELALQAYWREVIMMADYA